MKKEIICPDCGNTEFVTDCRTKETYCSRCGLIVDDNKVFTEDHTWETCHEPLSDGLDLESNMAEIERKNNFKSSSRNKYNKMHSRYYPILEDRLLELNYKAGEIEDIFNYCFKKYYVQDINSNALVLLDNGKKYQRTQNQVIEDFLTSIRFEAFNVASTVSKLKYQKKILGSTRYY